MQAELHDVALNDDLDELASWVGCLSVPGAVGHQLLLSDDSSCHLTFLINWTNTRDLRR